MVTDNRSNILACALRLFAARGYDAVGVQEVAAAAGITKPTLYHYFGSKQGLLDALLEAHFSQLLAQVRPAAAYEGDLPLTLERLVRAFFAFARADARLYRLQLALWFAPPDSDPQRSVARFNGELQGMLEALFIQATRDHGNMRGRHRRYAATLLGTINTCIGLALNGQAELDERLLREVVHQFQHGIYS